MSRTIDIAEYEASAGYPEGHFSRMTEHDLRDHFTDHIASLTHRIVCEQELERRGLQTRDAAGLPIGN